MSERLFRSIATHVSFLGETCTDAGYNASTITQLFPDFEDEPFPEIDFIPALNAALKLDLPNLASDAARAELLRIFQRKSIPLPAQPTIPRLLDKLSSLYLEPECQDFTFIINHPECMSPLSKSFIHPTAPNAQPVAARAELFVQGREIVNCYEEENSPFEQRRKFKKQQQHAIGNSGTVVDDEVMSIDEDYLRALEWGLPPTGGWGCGIDRLVMLFAGKERIGDVLSFGNLRAVTRSAPRRDKGDSEG
jgi:lysyl-tRNA synthetase class 2